MVTADGQVVGPACRPHVLHDRQRQGLGLGSTKESTAPWFVVGKDLEKNQLIVEQGYDSPRLYADRLQASGMTFFTGNPDQDTEFKATAKFRYRQCDVGVTVKYHAASKTADVYFDEPARGSYSGPGFGFIQWRGMPGRRKH